MLGVEAQVGPINREEEVYLEAQEAVQVALIGRIGAAKPETRWRLLGELSRRLNR